MSPQSDDNLTVAGVRQSEVWDHENGFYWFSHPTRLGKALAHYELYKRIVDLPGDIVELGVYKAASLLRLATFRSFLENDFSRRIIGFDAFGQFPTRNVERSDDLEFVEGFEGAGGEGLAQAEVEKLMAAKGFQNVELVAGNVFDTIPKFLEARGEVRIAFLHLDMDVLEPTAFALEALYDRVVPGGLLVFDDYNHVPGGSEAVDLFLEKTGLTLSKLPFYHIPAFAVKK